MDISNVSSDLIIQEAIKRLRERVQETTGIKLKYGDFKISFHDGVCQNVQFEVRGRCYSKKIKFDEEFDNDQNINQ